MFNKTTMNTKPMWGKAPKETAKAANKALKINKKISSLNQNAKLAQAKVETAKANRNLRLQSRNPITRFFAGREQKSIAAKENKIRRMEAKTKTAELNPELTALNARTEARVKVANAKANANKVGYMALAAGAAKLGRGLSDEGNQDAEKDRKHWEDIIKTVTGGDNDSGLEQGVL